MPPLVFFLFLVVFVFFLGMSQALQANLKLLEQGERERKATAAAIAKEEAEVKKEAARLARESAVSEKAPCATPGVCSYE